MADDTEESSTLAVLSKRVDFRGWKQSMLLYAMEKGDVDGIFTDDGSDVARGYQLIAALSHARRQSWKLLSGKLTGRVGRQITNPTLRDVWNTAITSASVAVPSQAQYQFALAMRAVEDACGGVEETAKQIARTRFKVALMTFEEQSTKGDVKAGFETYADGIRVAEQKLAHAGVIMSDEEKKEKFFAGFNPRSAQWNSVKTFWMQSDHTFDDILSRGVQQQHSLDAVEAEDNASGVRSFMAKSMRDEERNNECDYDRFNKRTKRDEESAHAHYTARGAGGKGGKSGNGGQTCRGVQVYNCTSTSRSWRRQPLTLRLWHSQRQSFDTGWQQCPTVLPMLTLDSTSIATVRLLTMNVSAPALFSIPVLPCIL